MEVSQQDKLSFLKDGYVVVRNLWTREDIGLLSETFDEMHRAGEIPGCFQAVSVDEARQSGDILKAYPRMMHPHRVNETAMRAMLDARILSVLEALLGEEAMAAQSMFYWKPPGAKGQALHQDNFYLKVEPGTCVAAWTAVDDADEENGTLFVVPNTQKEAIQCPHLADNEESFTRDEVDVPAGLTPVPVQLKAGDVLFFNGNVIHGSYPNTSTNRFRRAFICHYAGISARKISEWYFPLYAFDGSVIERDANQDGGPCGSEYEVAGPH